MHETHMPFCLTGTIGRSTHASWHAPQQLRQCSLIHTKIREFIDYLEKFDTIFEKCTHKHGWHVRCPTHGKTHIARVSHMEESIERIEFGDKVMRPAAWMTFIIFFVHTLSEIFDKDYVYAAVFATVCIGLSGALALSPLAPKRIIINKQKGEIKFIAHYPLKNLTINAKEISRIEWKKGEWDLHSRFVIYFFDAQDEIIYSMIGHAISKDGSINSVEDLPVNYRKLLEVVQNLIKEKNHVVNH